MFSLCHSLATLDLSMFDTSRVKDMSRMFYECVSLETVDLSSFDLRRAESTERNVRTLRQVAYSLHEELFRPNCRKNKQGTTTIGKNHTMT